MESDEKGIPTASQETWLLGHSHELGKVSLNKIAWVCYLSAECRSFCATALIVLALIDTRVGVRVQVRKPQAGVSIRFKI